MADDTLIPAAYTIPAEVKERIEREARQNDLNPSQYVRRILRDYFERQDAEKKSARKPAPVAA